MDLKRKFDLNDINNFLPDNYTIGTADYYNNKFRGMMPNYMCEYLELKSREEYNNEVHNEEMLKIIKENMMAENSKIIKKYEEIVKRSKEESEQQTTFSVPFLSEEDDIEIETITPLINELDLEDRKGTENVVCC